MARVNDVFYSIKAEIAALGEQEFRYLVYGYRKRDYVGEIRKLKLLHKTFERIRHALKYQGILCLTCNEIKKLAEGVVGIVGTNCKSTDVKYLDIDSSMAATWSASNPECIAYEDWERAMYAICEKIGFTLTRVDKQAVCNISYSLIKKDIPCEVFYEIANIAKTCKIKYDILADEKQCEVSFASIQSKRDCKVNYSKITARNKKCSLKFHDYVNIINCGVSSSLIAKIYECGLSVKFSKEKACPVLVSGSNQFIFSSFSVDNESELWKALKDMNIN